SVQFGTNMTSAAHGSALLYLIVSDIEAARDELVARGVEVSKVFHPETPGAQFQPDGTSGRQRACTRSRHLPLLRYVQRPGRQWLAAAGDHDAAARPDRRRSDGIRIDDGSGKCAAARGGRTWRAREAHRAARCELVRLVRRVHSERAVRQRAAAMNDR